MKNCLNCRSFSKCDDPRKGGSYNCSHWKAFKNTSNSTTLDDLFGKSLGVSSVEDGENHRDYDSFLVVDDAKNYRAKELNLNKMMDEVFGKSNTSPWPKDMKIDDSDLKEFPNIYDYFFDRELGLARNMKPFARQLWIGMVLFAEFCPRCSDKKFVADIENVDVKMKAIDFPDKVQFLNFGICPKCKAHKSDMVKKGELNYYRELAAVIGQRAGKSITVAFLATYLNHKYLKMQKPAELLTGLNNVTLRATFTATDFKTANETLWEPFCDTINESPWYSQYHSMLSYYMKKYSDDSLFKYMDSFIHYKHRKLFASAAAPNRRTLRGRSRYIAAIDELSHFDSSSEAKERIRISASGVYDALDRSMKTVRSHAKTLFAQGYDNIIPGMAFNISSPTSYQDFLMTKVRKFQGSRIVLTVHLPTWEFNPKEPRSNFTKEYEDDPVMAERDYGANPPLTDSPFISNEEIVKAAFTEKINKVRYEYVSKKKKDKDITLKAAIATPVPMGDIYPSLICIDAGLTNNSFALTVLTRKDKDVHIEACVEVIPDKGASMLHYPKIFDGVIKPLISSLNVKFITADRWNSVFLLQKCQEDFNIGWSQYSCKYSDFTLFKSFLEGGRIKFPRLEMKPQDIMQLSMDGYPRCFDFSPMSHLYLQLLTVSDTGKTVTKGTNRTDDIFRALVLGCHYMLDDDWVRDNMKGKKAVNPNRGIGALAGGGSGNSVTTATGKGIIAVGSAGI